MKPYLEFRVVNDSLEESPVLPDVLGHGAMVEFLGVVRPQERGKPIRALEYEAYVSMARKQGLRIVEEISSKHDLLGLQVIHRIGCVATGKISLRVRVWSTHREPAFLACSELIERLKQDVPIWKHVREE